MRNGLHVLLTLGLLAGLAWAKPNPAQPSVVGAYFTGTVGHGSAVQMSLLTSDAEQDLSGPPDKAGGKALSGSYFYEKVGAELALSGQLSRRGTAVLKEQDPGGNQTGTFSGKLDFSAGLFEGTWSSADGKRKLPFVLRKIATYQAEDGSGFHCIARSVYPVFEDDSPAMRRIGQAARAALETRRKEFLEETTEDAREFDKSNRPSSPATLNETCAITCVRGGVVSLLRTEYCYTWGAHGNTSYEPLHWRIEKGKARSLNLADLFRAKSDWQTKLKEECVRDLVRQKASDYTKGPVKLEETALPEAFYLTPEGITMVYAPYEAGCYAEGTYWVRLPFSKLQAVLEPDGPVRDLRAEAK